MSDETDNAKLELFKTEISELVEKFSVKLLEVIKDSDNEIPVEIFTMALMQIAAALAVQSSCTKDIFIKICDIAHTSAVKQEIKDLHSEINLFKIKISNDLN